MSASAISYAVWGLIAAGVLALGAGAHWRPRLVARPKVVLVQLATQPVLRVGLLVTFLWLGWHLFAR